MSSDENKRRLKRHAVDIDANVVDRMRSRARVGKLVNLHVEGMMVLVSEVVYEGGAYQLAIEAGREIDIRVGVECLWTREAAVAGHYWAGYRIIDLSPLARDQIIGLIASLSGEAPA